MSVPQNSENPSGPESAGARPPLLFLIKHALFFGFLGPLFGCLLAFAATLSITLVFRGSDILTHSLRQLSLRWLLEWIGTGYLYGGLPALATGACAAWFATLPFGKTRFTALTALTGWVLSFLYLLAYLAILGAVSSNKQAFIAFVAGAVGAASALLCLYQSRFLRR